MRSPVPPLAGWGFFAERRNMIKREFELSTPEDLEEYLHLVNPLIPPSELIEDLDEMGKDNIYGHNFQRREYETIRRYAGGIVDQLRDILEDLDEENDQKEVLEIKKWLYVYEDILSKCLSLPSFPRGFDQLSPEERTELGSKGGKEAHRLGHAYKFSSKKATEAGKIGGKKVSQDRVHMSEIGRKGAEAKRAKRVK
jgi:hypothetical protein